MRVRCVVPAFICCTHRAARDQPLPFFLPPEAFIHTHLPFEPCWQLLPQPVRAEAWWAGPGLSLGFAAVGGRLLDGGALSACTVVQLDRCAACPVTQTLSHGRA